MKTILFNAREGSVPGGEVRVAIVEGGASPKLMDLDVESDGREKNKGNIYRGIVTNVEPSLQAAFVDYGGTRHGFLPIGDVAPTAYRDDAPKNARQITDMLKRKQPITVQVLKDEIGSKGAALTTYVSLPGRYLVLAPGSDMQGISRKIESEEERNRIRQITQSLNPPKDMGLIVRTAGLNQAKQALSQDLKYLVKLWAQIEKKIAAAAHPPTLVHREQDITLRTLRDYLTPDVERVVFDTEESLEAGHEFIKQVAPRLVKHLELHKEEQSLFSAFGIESQVESLYESRVDLPSGGSLVIEQTEALVAIDVNSGKMTKPRDHEETAFQTNCQAAHEVARQLRLRDMGGIVVVDFIDMESAAHKSEVEKIIREAAKADKARMKIGHISPNGTLELTRQRIRSALQGGTTVACPHCAGTGVVRSAVTQNARLLRAVADRLVADKPPAGAQVVLTAASDAALRLLNERRRELAELEARHGVSISITPGGHGDAYQIEVRRP